MEAPQLAVWRPSVIPRFPGNKLQFFKFLNDKKVFIDLFLHFPRNTTNNREIAIPTCNSFGSNSAVAFLLEASAFDMFHPSNHACLAEAHCEPLLRISFGNLCTFDYLHREISCSSNKSLDGISI